MAGVADELVGEPAPHPLGQELGGLELLCHDEGLGLGAAPGSVVALEGQEHDEPEQDREPRREHAEHPCGSVAVVEVAAVGRTASDEQEHADRDPRRGHDDEQCPDEVHSATLLRRSFGTFVILPPPDHRIGFAAVRSPRLQSGRIRMGAAIELHPHRTMLHGRGRASVSRA